MSLYACPRHGGYHEHAHFCPACIEYVATFLRALSLDSEFDITRDNANRSLVMLGRPATRHQFKTNWETLSKNIVLCTICDLPESAEVHQ